MTLDRRRMLGMLGLLGGAALGACTDRGGGRRDPAAPAGTGGRGGTGTGTGTGTGGFAPAPADAARLTARSFEGATQCVRTPEQAEGPFHLESPLRRDIREGRPGTPLRVGVRVVDVRACAPVPEGLVEIWHCDAAGDYSGFEGQRGQGFLRGAQPLGAEGIAELLTIYPGWYSGRAPHVHAKVRVGEREVLTTQFYFPEGVNDAVFATAPYTERRGGRVPNDRDGLYVPDTVMTVSRDGDGLLALLTVGVDRA